MSDIIAAARLCRSCGKAIPGPETQFCPWCGGEDPFGHHGPHVDPLQSTLERALSDRYQLVRLLGRGGMGAVYLARELALDRLVAIKALPPDGGDATNADRFRREARIAAKLTHPNIVPLHAFGEADGVLYLVMGYVRGESLGARLARGGTQPPQEVRRILGEVAAALHYAHEQGIVHRDIKPDNILLDDETGRPMLTDFGIARSRVEPSTLTQAGATVGTVHYMSPEQASGDRDIDGRSDLYALGVVGYQMLSGELPFDSPSAREILVQHMTRESPALSVPGASDVVETVNRCLAKDPGDRPANGKIVQDALGVTVGRDEMPPELDWEVNHIRGMGFFTLGLAYLILLTMSVRHPEAVTGQLVLGGGLFITLIIAYYDGRRRLPHTHPLREVLWWSFRKPRWWRQLWWPSRLRPATDVWSRFPLVLKTYYASATLGAVAMVSVSPIVAINLSVEDPFHEAVRDAGFAVVMVSIIPMLTTFLILWMWRRRRGLSEEILQRLMTAPDSTSPFWKRPEIRDLLSDEAPATPTPATPEECVRAITDIAARLPPGRREVGAGAVTGAQEAVSALAARNRVIDQLRRNANDHVVGDLTKRLAELGDPQPGEPASHRRMRELLREELQLAESVQAELTAAEHSNATIRDALTRLWEATTRFESATESDHAHSRVQEALTSLSALLASEDSGEAAPAPS